MIKNGLFSRFFMFLLYFLVAFSASEKSYSSSIKQKDFIVINSLFDDAKIYCLGRYTFTYPTAFMQSFSFVTKVDDMTIESKFIYSPAFKKRIEFREDELNNLSVKNLSNAPFLKETIRLKDGVIFDHNIDNVKPDSVRELEAHVYVDNVSFIIKTELDDVSSHKYQRVQLDYKNHGWPLTDRPQKLAAMQSLISRLQGRPNNEIPSGKGICIPNGFIMDDGVKHQEEISMVFDSPQFYWAVDMDNTIESEKESMLDREGEIKSVLSQYGGRTLRKGKVGFNSVAGEEWLTLGKEPRYDNQSDKFYYFQYYANEKTIGYFNPSVSILMHSTNKLVDYTDEQMVEIWDRVLQSFKVRKNAY